MKVKTILVSQPEPKVEHSPYYDLQHKHKIKVDFRPFIHVESVSANHVRQQKIDLKNFTAIVLTSKNSVDHFYEYRIRDFTPANLRKAINIISNNGVRKYLELQKEKLVLSSSFQVSFEFSSNRFTACLWQI